MLTPFHSLFFLKATRRSKDASMPVYLRITVAGKRAELSTGRKILVSDSSAGAGKMKGYQERACEFNLWLNAIRSRLLEAYWALTMEGLPITVLSLKRKLKGEEEVKMTLVAVIQQHNHEIASLVPAQYAPATLEPYKTSLAHVVQFLKATYKAADIAVREIDPAFINAYVFFLRSVRKCSNNTAVKYLKNLKQII